MSPNDLEVHQRHFLKSKDKKQFIEHLNREIPGKSAEIQKIVDKKSKIEWIKLGNNEELYAIDDELAFWVKDDNFIPLLNYALHNEIPYKSVVVDNGAIKFMAKGADVMRPGILKIDSEIEKDEIVLIRDPNHNKVLMVGKALFNGKEMKEKQKGRVIVAIHSLSDNIWEFSKSF